LSLAVATCFAGHVCISGSLSTVITKSAPLSTVITKSAPFAKGM